MPTAGPSSEGITTSSYSSTARQEATCTFRELYDHLEGTRHSLTREQLGSILLSRLPQLQAPGEAFGKPSSASQAKLEAGLLRLDDAASLGHAKVTPEELAKLLSYDGREAKLPPAREAGAIKVSPLQRDLARRISERHELDQVQAYLLLLAFIESDERMPHLLERIEAAGEEGAAKLAKSQQQLKHSLRASSLMPSKAKEALSSSLLGAPVSAEELRTELLDQFNTFYFEERLYVMRCVVALVRIAKDDAAPHTHLVRPVAERLATQALALRCLRGFVALTQHELPAAVRDAPRYSVFWVKQCLREQLGLLEIVFLLYYASLQATAVLAVRLVDALRQTDFGRAQASIGFFNAEALQLAEGVTHLLVLIAVESVDLERTMDVGVDLTDVPETDRNDDDDMRPLCASAKDLNATLEYLATTGEEDAIRSPLLLGWAILTQRLSEAFEAWSAEHPHERLPPHLRQLEVELKVEHSSERMWQRLARAAMEPSLHLFRTMFQIVTSPLISTTAAATSMSGVSIAPASSLALRDVFKGLLLSVTEVVRVAYLPDTPALLQLWELAFGAGEVPEQLHTEHVAELSCAFWETDVAHGERGSVLAFAAERWPVSFRPLVRLATALTGACGMEDLHAARTREPSSAIARAGHATFVYLASLETLAQALPEQRAGRLVPYEILTNPDQSFEHAAYRAIERVPLFGTRSIRAGSAAQQLSEAGKSGPTVVVWQANEGRRFSAWRIMADVLASFVEMLPVPLPNGGGTGFDQSSKLVKFATLAPVEQPAEYGECAADILNLFAGVLYAGPELGTALLAQLSGPFGDDGLAEDDKTLPVNLVDVTMRILNEALGARTLGTRVVVSALRTLTLLVPLRPIEIFIALRSSNVLTGAVGSVPYLSRPASSGLDTTGTPVSKLLAHEVASGTYAGTLALLDLHTALLAEFQRSHFALPVEVLRLKADVLLRAASWLTECVWMEFQSWHYAQHAQQLDVGRRCAAFILLALGDESMRTDVLGASHPAAELGSAMQAVFVTHATPLHLAPLVATLGAGQHAITTFYRASRHLEADLAIALVLACLQLANRIVQIRRRRKLPQTLGLLEKLFYDHAVVATRPMVGQRSARVELASAVLGYTLMPLSAEISAEAAQLISAVCRSSVELAIDGAVSVANAPSLVSHFGSAQELEASMNGLVGLVDSETSNASLATRIWAMLASIVDSQPTLATLLLTGRHLDHDAESTLAAARADPTDKAKERRAPDAVLSRTALDVALEALLENEHLSDEAELLESIMRFLDTAWSHALEHPAVFESIRNKQHVWDAVADLIEQPPPVFPGTPMSVAARSDGTLQTDAHANAQQFAYKTMVRARALGLLARDVQASASLQAREAKGKGAASSGSSTPGSLQMLLKLLSDPARITAILQDCVRVRCDPEQHGAIEARLAEAFPAVPLSAVRNAPRLDDFDTSRRPGDNYLFDAELMRHKLDGYIGTAALEQGPDASMADASEDNALVLHRAFGLVASLNLDWSVIDAQAALLRAWTNLLQVSLGRIGAEVEGKPRAKELQRSCLQAWTACAALTANETRSGNVMRGIHAARVELLTVLMEAAWGGGQSVPAHASPGGDRCQPVGTPQHVVDAAEHVCGILARDNFSIEDSIRGTRSPAFHGGLFRIVLMAARRSRKLLARVGQTGAEPGLTAELHRDIHRVSDVFASHTIIAMRLLVDGAQLAAQAAVQASAITLQVQQAEEDLTLVSSVLELLLRPDLGLQPHFWAAKFHTTGLLSACVDLLSRAPVISDTPNAPPLYVMPLLNFFFALATQPEPAEQLILAGVMTGLCSNSLTAQLEAAALRPVFPAHASWVLMLRTVVALVDSLAYGPDAKAALTKASVRFVEVEVQGFVRVYGAQILAALDFAPLTSSAPGGFGYRQSFDARGISVAQLDEVDAVVRLFLCMARASERSDSKSSASRILGSLAKRTAALLQQVVYLLQHPRELASLIDGGLQRDAEDDTANALLSKAEIEALKIEEALVTQLLRDIAQTAVAALSEWSDAAETLVTSPGNWLLERIVVVPSIRTSPSTPTSVGTLLDLSTNICETIRTPRLAADAVARHTAALEQVLVLCATQLAMSHALQRGEAVRTGKVEMPQLEAGLVRDLEGAIESARSAALDTQKGAREAAVFFDALAAFAQKLR